MSNPDTARYLSANDLLYGFDICDEETKQFLTSLIDSRRAPQTEIDELRDISLLRGAEEWNMLFECASNLQKRMSKKKDVSSTVPPTPARASQTSFKTITQEQESQSRLHSPNQSATSHAEATQTLGRAVKATGGLKSPFFLTEAPTRRRSKPTPSPPSTAKKSRPPRGVVSSLPIPPLTADRFGLIQEELANDPFRLLIAVTFLIRTSGKVAIPVFWQLMERFPTAEALAAADPEEVTALIRPLGLSAVRCAAIQNYARGWLERPPTRDVRYGVKNYPRPGDARHVRAGEEFGPEDDGANTLDSRQPVDAAADAMERAVGCAWEIGHLTQGPYALDSWRIFCRDVLLGRSCHWTGRGSPPEFQPEWMRVLPRDKELRACLRWMWMREGWEWDPLTGEREPLREDLRLAVNDGRVGYDDGGNLVILR
ncbi:hypothetical protein VTH06DRAFT_4334 [Thermothelomyces fergusii]